MDEQRRLTSAEMAGLWTTYMNDSKQAVCELPYFLQHVEDDEIRTALEYALQLSRQHIQIITVICNEERFPIPHGFIDSDVNLSAPRLFSDVFYLTYLNGMTEIALTTYSGAFTCSSRLDVRDFFHEWIRTTTELNNRVTWCMLKKGVHILPPFISTPDKVDFVRQKHFLAGFLGKRRTLTAIAITNIFMNLRRNVLQRAHYGIRSSCRIEASS